MASGPVVGSDVAPGKLQAVNKSKIPAKYKNGRILFAIIQSSLVFTSH